MTSLVHPEIIEGRRIWLDGPMQDVIDKMQQGDPTKGWAGDPNLYLRFEPIEKRFEVWRLEDDGVHRMTMRSAPGVPLHDGLIDWLVANDRRRFTKSLHDQIVEKNEAHEREVRRVNDDFIREEVNPRLDWALKKDGLA